MQMQIAILLRVRGTPGEICLARRLGPMMWLAKKNVPVQESVRPSVRYAQPIAQYFRSARLRLCRHITFFCPYLP